MRGIETSITHRSGLVCSAARNDFVEKPPSDDLAKAKFCLVGAVGRAYDLVTSSPVVAITADGSWADREMDFAKELEAIHKQSQEVAQKDLKGGV
jgi:hypothetical protein